ncbi:MAG: TonB-dependent receptor, partial [Pseudomonadota bacterium]
MRIALLIRRAAAVGTFVFVVSAFTWTAPVHAQNASPAVRDVRIAAGPLSQTLISISNTFGVSILADGTLLADKQATAISGALTLDAALARALEGTDLAVSEARAGTYRVARTGPTEPADNPVQQQPTPPGDNETGDASIDEVVVFGVKQRQSVQDVEISAEIFNEERLAREQITELAELLLKVPNVTTTGGADANFSIRGIGRSGVGGAGQGVTSSVYVDGSPVTGLNFNRGPLGLWDVDQVEVLRGPQSSIQGRNALAGGIFVKTTDPTFETEGKIRATYAEGDTYQVAGAISSALIDGLLAGRIAVDAQGSNGFLKNSAVGNIDFNVTENLTIRTKLLLAPDGLPAFTSKLTVDVGASEVFGEDNLRVLTPSRLTDPNFTDFDPSARITARNELVGNDNDGLRVVSETAFDFSEAVTGRALLTYEDYSTRRTFGDENDVARFGAFTSNQFDETIISAETRLEFEFETVQGLVGAYFLEEERVSDRNTRGVLLDQARSVAGPLAPLISVTPPESLLILRNGETFTSENYAIFGQIDWQFAPNWTLGLGARYDVEDIAESDRFFSSGVDNPACGITAPAVIFGIPSPDPFAPVSLPCQLAVEQFFGPSTDPTVAADFSAFLPRMSLTYDVNERSSVFVSLSRGYRAGGAFVAVEQNPAVAGFVQFVGQYDPEFLDTFEIGTRNVLFDGRLVLNANAFLSTYEDQQVLVDGFDPARTDDDRIVNAGESTLYGLEISADFEIN